MVLIGTIKNQYWCKDCLLMILFLFHMIQRFELLRLYMVVNVLLILLFCDMALRIKIVNNRDDDMISSFTLENNAFPPEVYKHLYDKIWSYHKIGIKCTIIVQPIMAEGNIF